MMPAAANSRAKRRKSLIGNFRKIFVGRKTKKPEQKVHINSNDASPVSILDDEFFPGESLASLHQEELEQEVVSVENVDTPQQRELWIGNIATRQEGHESNDEVMVYLEENLNDADDATPTLSPLHQVKSPVKARASAQNSVASASTLVPNKDEDKENRSSQDDALPACGDEATLATPTSLSHSKCSVDKVTSGSNAVGSLVMLIGGKYPGRSGRIVKLNPKTCRVKIDGVDGARSIAMKNVQFIHNKIPEFVEVSLPMEEEKTNFSSGATQQTSTECEYNLVQNNGADDDSTTLQVGQRVKISSYEGNVGVILRLHEKKVAVDVESVGKKTILRSSVVLDRDWADAAAPSAENSPRPIEKSLLSISPVASNNNPNVETEKPPGKTSSSDESPVASKNYPNVETEPPGRTTFFEETSKANALLQVGQQVKIVGGNHEGRYGKLEKLTPKMAIPGLGRKLVTQTFLVPVDGSDGADVDSPPGRPRALLTAALETKTRFSKPAPESSGDEWKVEDSQSGGTRFGNRHITKLRPLAREQKVEDTFLTHLFGRRLKIVEIPLNKEENVEPFDIAVEENGSRYELISVKVQNDGDAGSMQYSVQVRGPKLAPISLPDLLLDIADFSSLKPRKVMARLELLQSPAFNFPNGKKGMFFLKASDFIVGFPNGNDGSSYICEDFLMNLCGNNAFAKRILALQFRAIIPSLGIFKGMLVRIRITSGPPIQLDPSQLKVPPSQTGSSDDRAFLLITSSGVQPSSTNEYVGRLLDPQAKPPPKSFKIKPMKDMIPRLWSGLGVPEDVCQDYVKKSVRQSYLNHAWVVGVADPTGSIPTGHVFVTGMKGQVASVDNLFVTRSPCTKPDDGRVLPQLVQRPNGMSTQDWDWLKNLHFGAIIFAAPGKGMRPLPERIASGDLDGDLYFVCWNEAILGSIQTLPVTDLPVEEESSSDTREHYDDWFKEAQQLMVGAGAVEEMGALTGKLYTLFTKTADESKDKIADPDAVAYADAYNQALEFGKHGNKLSCHYICRLKYQRSCGNT
jgi:ribosomal protein L24